MAVGPRTIGAADQFRQRRHDVCHQGAWNCQCQEIDSKQLGVTSNTGTKHQMMLLETIQCTCQARQDDKAGVLRCLQRRGFKLKDGHEQVARGEDAAWPCRNPKREDALSSVRPGQDRCQIPIHSLSIKLCLAPVRTPGGHLFIVSQRDG